MARGSAARIEDRGPIENLKRYWFYGPGAAKIRWGVPGDFNRCVRNLRKYVRDPEGWCYSAHREVLGTPPGRH